MFTVSNVRLRKPDHGPSFALGEATREVVISDGNAVVVYHTALLEREASELRTEGELLQEILGDVWATPLWHVDPARAELHTETDRPEWRRAAAAAFAASFAPLCPKD